MSFPSSGLCGTPALSEESMVKNHDQWTLDHDRVALVIQDMQRCFFESYDVNDPALVRSLAATQKNIEMIRAVGVPIIHVIREMNPTKPWRLHDEFWGRVIPVDSEQAEIVQGFRPKENDFVVSRNAYSAFSGEGFEVRLRELGIDQIILLGTYAHIGITATAFDAFERDIYSFVMADAVFSFNEILHRSALELIANSCGAIVAADVVVDELSRLTATGDKAAWEKKLYEKLVRGLGPEAADQAFSRPSLDLFNLGLNSIQAFAVLDDLADVGVDIEFSDFIHCPTIEFLRERAGVS